MNDANFDLSHWIRDSVGGLEKELITGKGRFLLQLQDPVLYREFREFMSLSKAWRFAILLNLVITFVFVPPIISQALGGPVSTFTCLEFLLIILTVTSGWISFLIMREDSPVRRYCSFLLSWTRNTSWQSLSDQLQAVLYLSLVMKLRNEAQLSMKANDHVTDLRILLAEDTPSIAKMMKLLLNRQRHDVTVAENGQIALDMLSEGKYDVVLMDLQMPVMDGLEATRRIRAGERSSGGNEHQILIGVSANSDNETIEEGLRAGIDDFLPKPFSMEAFIGAIKRAEEKYGKNDEAILMK